MRETFSAEEISVQTDEDAVVCAFRGVDTSGRERYLLLQRQTHDGGDDEGVHFELDDEACSGYELVLACMLTPTSLEIRLSGPLGNRQVQEVKIELSGMPQSRENLTEALKQVFRDGTHGTLHVSVASLPPN